MNLPSLSVVIPNYNHARYLPRCLDALLAQSVQPQEILVIDDASTDDSLAVIQGYAARHPHLRVFQNEVNRKLLYSMNRGIELARGDYLYFAAADDEVLPGFLEKSLALLAAHPEAALSCTIGDWREESTGFNWHVGVGMGTRPAFFSPGEMVELERRDRLFIATHAAIIKRAALIRAGGFHLDLKYHCDWFAYYTAAFREGICFVPEPLAVMHILGGSFYQGQKRDPVVHREVLRRMLERLHAPDCADVLPAIRRSGALFLFGWPMFRLLLGSSSGRRLLTPTFLRKNLWHAFKLSAKRFTPRFMADWYFRLAGYRAK